MPEQPPPPTAERRPAWRAAALAYRQARREGASHHAAMEAAEVSLQEQWPELRTKDASAEVVAAIAYASSGPSGADLSVTTGAPPTITIVETAEAAAEMTAMESMTSAPVAATKAVTTAAKTAAVTTTAHSATAHSTAAVTATTTHQDQRTARCTKLLGVAGIARQRGQ
jgi:hypothetical protein